MTLPSYHRPNKLISIFFFVKKDDANKYPRKKNIYETVPRRLINKRIVKSNLPDITTARAIRNLWSSHIHKIKYFILRVSDIEGALRIIFLLLSRLLSLQVTAGMNAFIPWKQGCLFACFMLTPQSLTHIFKTHSSCY